MSVDPRFTQALLDDEAVAGGRVLTDLAGRPDALVVLGSGLADALDEAWGAPAATVPLGEIPGVVTPVADGHGGELRAYETSGGVVLVATGAHAPLRGAGCPPRHRPGSRGCGCRDQPRGAHECERLSAALEPRRRHGDH